VPITDGVGLAVSVGVGDPVGVAFGVAMLVGVVVLGTQRPGLWITREVNIRFP